VPESGLGPTASMDARLRAWKMNIDRRRRSGSTAKAASQPGPARHALIELVPAVALAAQGVGAARYVLEIGDARLEFGDDAWWQRYAGARGTATVLSLPPTVRLFVAVEPIDMRGSVRRHRRGRASHRPRPRGRHLYLFLNKRRRLAKALWSMGRAGACSQTSRGWQFSAASAQRDKPLVVIDGSTFASLLAGIDFTARDAGCTGDLVRKSGTRIDTDPQV